MQRECTLELLSDDKTLERRLTESTVVVEVSEL